MSDDLNGCLWVVGVFIGCALAGLAAGAVLLAVLP